MQKIIEQWLLKPKRVSVSTENYNFNKECNHNDSNVLFNLDAKSFLKDVPITNISWYSDA